ncbi:MAG: ATP-binding protein [Acidobacteria bacterium]|nr:ATP-binding protein [Acidobacteriota bacterium]
MRVGVAIGNKRHSIQEEATLFSKIDDASRKDELIKPLKFLDNRLRDLAVSVASGTPMINCDIGLGQRIPLSQMGEGMAHFFSVISEIVHTANGVVLIDEIDNGLHYSVMVDVWKAIAQAAEKSDTQIFATTHSFECIRAAHQAFSERYVYDLRLHRLERVKDEIRAITYDQEMLEAALMTDLEVR